MRREAIIRMALEAGIDDPFDELWHFAAMVAAAEREACAQVCEAHRDLREEARASLRAADALETGDEDTVLRALRHDSNVRLYNAGIDKCAASIRAKATGGES